MNYFNNFSIQEFEEKLLINGFAKLPSIISLSNFDELRRSAIVELGNKTFKSNLNTHKKILNLMKFNEVILPSLTKIAKQKLNFNEKNNNSYHIARLIKPGQNSESYRGHFDSHSFTMVLPILIPNDKNIDDRGQLICFPNFRSHPKNELINILQKIYYKKYFNKRSIEILSNKKKCVEFDFEDYEPVVFLEQGRFI